MILYSFRRCPWAMRARLALRYAGCEVEIREVAMKNKPAELLALSPKGTVPVLDTGAGVLEESLDIMRWALAQNDPQDWRLQADPAAAQQAETLIARNDSTFKAQVNLYKYAERYPEHTREHYRQQAEAWLAELEGLLAGRPYLLATHPSIADAALLPLMRQFAGVEPQWFAEAAIRGCGAGWRGGWLRSCSGQSWPNERCFLYWPYRRQASSHRYGAGPEACSTPVGAGLPAIGPVQDSVVVFATQCRMEVGTLAQVLFGVAMGSRRLAAAVGMGMRRQYDRSGNGGCGNDREEIEVHLG